MSERGFQLRLWLGALALVGVASPAGAAEGPSAPPTAAVLALPSGPGSIRGLGGEADLDVASGQVRYSIDIEVPRGHGGLAPPVALTYDGGLGNGPIGLGWSLQVPAIHRSLRAGVPAYADDDLLEAVHISGGSGDLVALEPGTFGLEGRGRHVRIRRADGGFVVDDGDGSTLRFGQHPQARREADGRVASWFVEEVADRHGHRITYAYHRHGNERLLRAITWGPDQAFRVNFDYENRPDATVSMRTGFALRSDLRLRSVGVSSHGQLLRSYQLGYLPGSGLSRLAQVQLQSNDRAVSLPPVQFSYAEPGEPTTFQLRNHHNWRPGPRETLLVDLDGDGIGDLLSLADGAWLRNRGGSFEDPRRTAAMPMASLERSRLVDIDNDGKPELLMESGQLTWDVWRFDGDRWQHDGTWPGSGRLPLIDPKAHLVDINGDGYPDSLTARHGRLHIAFGGPKGFSAPFDVPDLPTIDAALSSDKGVARLVDINGDGLVDVVGLGDDEYVVHLGRGDGTFEDLGSFRYPWGSGLGRPSQLHLVDLNRDGIADMVATAGDNVYLYQGLDGVHFDPAARKIKAPSGDDRGTITFADLNGNGSVDVLWPTGWAADLAGATSAGMLVRIDNGLGLTTDFSYDSAAQLSARADQVGGPWRRHTAHNIPVCTRIEHTTAHDGVRRSVELSVRDAIWDHENNRFGGFLETTSTEVGESAATSLVSWTRYHDGLGNDRPLRGRSREHAQYAADHAQPARRSSQEFWRAILPQSLREFPRPTAFVAQLVETVSRQEQGAAQVATRTRHAYDDEGRVTVTHELGREDMEGDEAIVHRAYASSDGPWVRDVVIEERLEDGTGNLMSHVRHQFDGESDALPYGEVTLGLLRRTTAFLGDEDRWLVLNEADYDAHGNPTRTVAEGRERRIDYDEDGLHPVREALTTGRGDPLVWALAWDRIQGVPTERTSPSGGRERVEYDALGRVVALAHGDHAPHTRFSYQLASPTSHVLTELDDGNEHRRHRISAVDGAGRDLATGWRMDRDRWLVSERRERNGRGQLSRQWQPFFAERATSAPPSDAPMHGYTYDVLGRSLTHERPNGSVRRWQHGPFCTIVEEPDLARLVRQKNGRGLQVRSSRVPAAGEAEEARASYDGAGRLAALDLEGGRAVRRHDYDTLGRLVATVDPDAGAYRFAWNDAGWLTSIEHAAGHHLAYSYDQAGRVVERSDGDTRVVYHYDRGKEPWQQFTHGQLAWAQDPAGATLFSYSPEGRLARVDREIDGVRASRRYRYSTAGLLFETHTEGGPSLARAYDPAGRLTAIGDLWRVEERSAAGGILREAYGNGVVQTYARDAADQVRGLGVEQGGARLLELEASLTSFGAVASVKDRTADATIDRSAAYRYDPFGRLVHAAVAGFTFDYAYDGLQNLTSRAYEGPRPLDMLAGDYTYGASGDERGPRQLVEAGGVQFLHDAGGRVINAGETELQWDGFNRLRSATLGDGRHRGAATEYLYGFDGQQALARGPDGVHRQFFDDLSEHGGRWTQRVVAEGRTLARLQWCQGDTSQQASYLHPSITPGIALITDASGEVIDNRLFEAFGAEIAADYSLDSRGLADKPRDADTGWVDHGARWMAPQFAQWLTPDLPTQAPSAEAIATAWDLNPYQVNRQNPVLFHDPDGNMPHVLAGATIGLVAGGAIEVGRQFWQEGSLTSFKAVAVAAGAGAATGAVASASMGLSTAGYMMTQGAASAAAGSGSRAALGQAVSVNSIASDFAIGVATAGVARAASSTTQAVSQHPSAAANRTMHEMQKVLYREQMGTPHSVDPKLTDFISRQYKEGANIGSGSSAAAHRHEALTGMPVKGRMHGKKIHDSNVFLRRWLEKNSIYTQGENGVSNISGRHVDRAAAENIFLDNQNALGGK